jgi:bacteriocin biosynthesis cyclodehydratase domain-containing protein
MAAPVNDEARRDGAVLAARYAELDIPSRPRLSPWVAAVDVGDDRLQLRSSESVSTLTHPLLIRIFHRIQPLLDGRHTLDEIAAAAGADVQPTTVHFVLKLLKGRGLLQAGPENDDPADPRLTAWTPQLRFLSHFLEDAIAAQRAIGNARVGIAGTGELSRAVADALHSIGLEDLVEVTDAAGGQTDPGGVGAVSFIVACGDGDGSALFDAVNRACLQDGTRWLRVAMSGTSAEIGPTVVPRQTACSTCLDLRRQTHEPDLPGYLAYRGGEAGRASLAHGGTKALLMTVAGQVALEVMRLVTGFAPPVTIGRYVELRAATPATVVHDVLKVPRCPACDSRQSLPEAWDRGYAMIGLEL